MASISELPAILGGPAAIPEGPPSWPLQSANVRESLHQVFESGDWGRYHGKHCQQLTEALAAYHHVEHVHLCCSGTTGIELALRAAKVGPGDEVILAAYDFKANMQNVLAIGATPVLVDLEPNFWQLDAAQLQDAITEKTKAIIASHLHGGHVDLSKVMETAKPHNIVVIEDACQNPGAIVQGQIAGTTGDVGVLSFGGSKLLTAGRGGAVITNRSDIAQRMRLYTQRGNDSYPLSELQAAVLIPQLETLDEQNRQRAVMAKRLCKHLEKSQLLVPLADFSSSESVPSFYKFGAQLNSNQPMNRSQFSQAMRAEGIAFDAGFDALHRTHSKRRYRAHGDLSIAESAHAGCVVLHHPILLDDADAIDLCANAINKIESHADAIANTVGGC